MLTFYLWVLIDNDLKNNINILILYIYFCQRLKAYKSGWYRAKNKAILSHQIIKEIRVTHDFCNKRVSCVVFLTKAVNEAEEKDEARCLTCLIRSSIL